MSYDFEIIFGKNLRKNRLHLLIHRQQNKYNIGFQERVPVQKEALQFLSWVSFIYLVQRNHISMVAYSLDIESGHCIE
jgi:hypothetical protein